MIITNIIGGLGNQMFQYSIGMVLAHKHNTELLLDTRMFQRQNLRTFELNEVFNIHSRAATDREIRQAIGWKANKIIARLLREPRFAFLRGNNFFIEPVISYVKEVHSLPADCYISGHWQSDRYFKNHESLIREQFRFKKSPEGKNKDFVQKIVGCNAVSLHVRRGDFISNAHTNATHGTCLAVYYDKAIRYIEDRVNNPVYFVFSDDMDWVKGNIRINNEHYFIDFNSGLESYNDMRLMSLCKHHIIANSSFSWWGAWLNQNKEKTVVAPEKWFANGASSHDHVPSSWHRC